MGSPPRPRSGIGSRLGFDKRKATGYSLFKVRIRSFAHRGVKQLYEQNVTKGVPAEGADKLRKMLAFLDGMQDPDELHALPVWKAHVLKGDRAGTWSLALSRNRRLTFRIDSAEWEIYDVNLEDYH